MIISGKSGKDLADLIQRSFMIVEKSMIQKDWENVFSLRKWKMTVILKSGMSYFHNMMRKQVYHAVNIKNFHKKISMTGYIVPLEEKQTGVPHRAARYYKFDKKAYNKIHGTNKLKNESSTL